VSGSAWWRRPRGRRAGATAALVALLAGLPRLASAGPDAPAPAVRCLRFEGVESVPRGELEDSLLTSGPGWRFWRPHPAFDAVELDADMQRIADFYRGRGYFEASASHREEWNAAHTEVAVTIRVHEGEPVRLQSVSIEASEPGTLAPEAWDAVRRDLPLHVGEIFGARDYQAARGELLSRLAERAHPSPTLSGGADVDLASHTARIHWRVAPGPLVRFGPIEIKGLQRVDEHIVRRELRFAPGDRYSLDAQRKSQRAIFDLGLFRSASVQAKAPAPPAGGGAAGSAAPAPAEGAPPEPAAKAEPAEEQWPVEVRVQERPPRTLRVGAGFGTEDLLRGQVEWEYRNFLGEARILDVRARASFLSQGLEARLAQPHFLQPRIRLETKAYGIRETVPAYDALRAGTSFELYRKLGPSWEARGGYQLEYGHVTSVRVASPLTDSGERRVSALDLGLRRSTVGEDLDPHSGTWLDLDFSPSLEAIGSSASYLTFTAEGRAFVPLWWTSVLALRLKLGSIEPVLGSRSGDVPIFRRFFAGGSTSVRGYEYQKLGPLNYAGDPIGGLSLLESTAELRFPIWGALRGVVFVDSGLVGTSPTTFPLHALRYSAGPGLRLTTPVGPLRVDLGFPLNPPSGAAPFQVHLSVGNVF
jgi:outer membrane protein insertion porin family